MWNAPLITILMASSLVFAGEPVTEFSHWQPSLHLNLFSHIEELKGADIGEDDISKANKLALRELYNKNFFEKTKRKKYITDDEAHQLLTELKNHPVVGYDAHTTYDPNLQYGFCFGRATWVWLEALKKGFEKDSIKKVFLVGPMQTETVMWQFHVATAIRKKGLFRDKWVVIDSNLDRVVDVEEFFETYKKTSVDKKLRLIISDPQRLGPSSTVKFGPVHYTYFRNDPMYNKYFQDMLADLNKRTNYGRTNKCKYLF